MKAIDRLMRYLVVRTPSDENNDGVCPSSPDEFKLANLLADELRELGIEDVQVTDKFTLPLFASVLANPRTRNAYLVVGFTLRP